MLTLLLVRLQPLHMAAYYDQAEIIPLLVEKGAYVDSVDFQVRN